MCTAALLIPFLSIGSYVLYHSLVLDLTFEENIQSPLNLEMFTFPLLDGGREMSVTMENKVHTQNLV